MPVDSRITEGNAAEAFRSRFGEEPDFLVRTPGRVNLIGEHTDYNGGYVFPMTIDRALWMAVKKRGGDTMRVYSADYDKECLCDLSRPLVKGADIWFEYIKGCAWALQREGRRLTGLDAALLGDVPQGAGLSSSAALEITSLLMFCELGGYELSGVELAKLGQRAENQWVGVRCGIMDQTICALGQEDKALMIDCRNLEHRLFDLPSGTVVAVLDTATRHSLAASAYNERREQCEEACRALGVPLLRDASRKTLDAARDKMSGVAFRRASHVLSENMRAIAAGEALLSDDAKLFGRLMNESHASLRDDFEVSCAELDAMADIARGHPACIGARMTGGGFGGSAVALLDARNIGDFAEHVSKRYLEKTGKSPSITICRATDGGKVIRI